MITLSLALCSEDGGGHGAKKHARTPSKSEPETPTPLTQPVTPQFLPTPDYAAGLGSEYAPPMLQVGYVITSVWCSVYDILRLYQEEWSNWSQVALYPSLPIFFVSHKNVEKAWVRVWVPRCS